MEQTGKSPEERLLDRLYVIPLIIALLLAAFAVAAQHDRSLLTGFWRIQVSEMSLISDPMATGGVGAGLLNAAVALLLATLLVLRLKLPFTGATLACLSMVAGFALLGKTILNMAPIVLGTWLYACYRQQPMQKYVYLALYGTCMGPWVSFTLVNAPVVARWLLAPFLGVIIGFLLPPVAEHTTRVHQGYNLYNVGFAAGLLGMGLASVGKVFGFNFDAGGGWSQEWHALLTVMSILILLSMFIGGVACGCRSWSAYKRIFRHTGRAAADFILLDGPAVTLVNMAATGGIGLAYLLALYPLGVRLSGPLLCCVFSAAGFGAFGKHPKNMVWPMLGAVLAALAMGEYSLVAPGVLLATLFSTALSPVAGQFGWHWGVVAGFLHMAVVQHTGVLHGGLNLYNNGFAAGLVCVFLIPIIEAFKADT